MYLIPTNSSVRTILASARFSNAYSNTFQFRYISNHRSLGLDRDSGPDYDYLGHPLNSYHLVRHAGLGWEELRGAENRTRKALGTNKEIKMFFSRKEKFQF